MVRGESKGGAGNAGCKKEWYLHVLRWTSDMNLLTSYPVALLSLHALVSDSSSYLDSPSVLYML